MVAAKVHHTILKMLTNLFYKDLFRNFFNKIQTNFINKQFDLNIVLIENATINPNGLSPQQRHVVVIPKWTRDLDKSFRINTRNK